MSARVLRLTDAQLDLYRQRRSGIGNAELVDAKRIGARLPDPPEREIQAAVLELLRHHPKIAFAWRANTGVARYADPRDKDAQRFVVYGFRGCADILAVLRGSGRFVACEVKRRGQEPTSDQAAFLEAVNVAGGLGFVARSVTDAMRALERA